MCRNSIYACPVISWESEKLNRKLSDPLASCHVRSIRIVAIVLVQLSSSV
jgi:hypothetical protein